MTYIILQMSEYFILHGKELIKLYQHVTESKQAFIQRVNFLIEALSQGHSVPKAKTLSYAYQNKLQYSMLYPADFENILDKILCALNNTSQKNEENLVPSLSGSSS